MPAPAEGRRADYGRRQPSRRDEMRARVMWVVARAHELTEAAAERGEWRTLGEALRIAIRDEARRRVLLH